MVLDYYNLREQPFGGTPGSRFQGAQGESLAALEKKDAQ